LRTNPEGYGWHALLAFDCIDRSGFDPLDDEDQVATRHSVAIAERAMGFSAMLTRSVPEPWETLPAIDHFNKARHDSSMFQCFRLY
jgi:hypothetical protein